MRMLYVAAVIGLSAAHATAQFPGQGYGYPNQGGYGYPNQYGGGYGGGYGGAFPPLNPMNVMPNIYNPANQPLSPYLNLLRGGNAGVNYFYGVRPGTVGGGAMRGAGAPFMAMGGNRAPFFPQIAASPDLLESTGPDDQSVLPPAGHPVVYNNTLGYFPSPFGQAGGNRAALGGLGTTRATSAPPPKK